MAGGKKQPIKKSTASKGKTEKVVTEKLPAVVTPKVPQNLGKNLKETVKYYLSTLGDTTKDITFDTAAANFCNDMGPLINNPAFGKEPKAEKQLVSTFSYYIKDLGFDKDLIFKAPEVTVNELERPMQSEPVPFLAETIDLENVDKSLFVPLKTGTAFDLIASKRGGVMKGTVYILSGESGAGKTTVATNIADYMKEQDPTLTDCFISAEMDKTDWTEECFDNPRLSKIPTIFLLNYLDAPNYVEVLIQGLTSYNFVILDSFEVVIDQLKDRFGWTAKKAETELLNILRAAAAKGTTIFCIQQYTKGGTFVGSNKIKHLVTGMMFVMWDKDGDRYITFVKNRRGGHMVQKKLYYTKNIETGRLEFDRARFESEQALRNVKRAEAAKTLEDNGLLDQDLLLRAAELVKARDDRNEMNTTDKGSGSIIPNQQRVLSTSNDEEEEEA